MQSPTIVQFLAGLTIAGLVSLASVRFRLLTRGGGLAAMAVGTMVFGLGGIPWSLPLLAFFVLSSLVSRIPWRSRTGGWLDEFYQKGSRRDAWQVIANGGVAMVIVALAYLDLISHGYLLFGATLAAAAGDTWGTEVGGRVGGRTMSIATLKQVPPGTSGGISCAGTLACLIGSGTVGLAAHPWYTSSLDLLVVVGCGCIGTVVDSIVGSTLQRRDRCSVCGMVGERTEHCGVPTHYDRGLRYVDNDIVNLIATLSAALAASAFTYLAR